MTIFSGTNSTNPLPSMNGSELLTVKEAARILKISERQVYYLISRNEIGHIDIGQRIKRLTQQDVEEYIERQHTSF